MLEVLLAIADQPNGIAFAALRARLRLPKSSLHRLLRSLEQERYLLQKGGLYVFGPESVRLAHLIARAAPSSDFPASTRPVLEWLARETGESIILAVLTDSMTEVVYIDVINSVAPLRISVPVGNRRPLYSAASGKATLAFMPEAFRERYVESARFEPVTEFTTTNVEMPAVIAAARRDGAVHDRNGSFLGMSAVASPAFDPQGNVYCAVSIAGPSERIDSDLLRLRSLSREAGERISRILGYLDAYPPAF